MRSPIVRRVVIPAAVSYVCVLVIGFALHGARIFNSLTPAFAFVVYGLVFSAFLFFYRYQERNAFALLLALYLFNEVAVNHAVGYGLFGRDLIYFSLLMVASVFYVRFFDRSRAWNHYLAPLVLGFLFFVAIFAGLIILYFWWRLNRSLSFVEYLKASMAVYVPSVFLVGVGIGIGVLLDGRGVIHQAQERLRRWLA
jgi:hypothetical protein